LSSTLSSRPEEDVAEAVVLVDSSMLEVEVDAREVDVEVLACRPEFTAR
jgi:hypothetical protein